MCSCEAYPPWCLDVVSPKVAAGISQIPAHTMPPTSTTSPRAAERSAPSRSHLSTVQGRRYAPHGERREPYPSNCVDVEAFSEDGSREEDRDSSFSLGPLL